MSHTQQVSAQLGKIPTESLQRKWLTSLMGIALIAVGVAMPTYLGFPWYIGTGVFGFGCFLVSKDLVTSYLRFIPAVIRDIYAAVKGD